MHSADYLSAGLLGIVEGLTEFLPVSSTGHLILADSLLGIEGPESKLFDIVIQLGAILCLPIYFRARISEFLSTFPNGRHSRRTVLDHPLSLTAIAFVVTAVPALLLTKVIGKNLESIHVMGAALLIGGVVMWVVDARYGKPPAGGYRTNDMEDMTLGQAIWIGACQTTSAVFPGTSRSMSTIAGGQLVGMSRPAALEFSFFLSMPTMIAATAYDLFKSLHHQGGGSEIGIAPADVHGWIILAIGFVVSFVVAYAVVAWFMHWVRKHGFAPFAVYRIVVGIAVLAWAMSAAR